MKASQLKWKIKLTRITVFKTFLSLWISSILLFYIGVKNGWPAESIIIMLFAVCAVIVGLLFYLNTRSVKMLQDILLVQGNPELFTQIYLKLGKKKTIVNFIDQVTYRILELYNTFFSGDYKTIVSFYGSVQNKAFLGGAKKETEFMSYYVQSLLFLNDYHGVRDAYSEAVKIKRAYTENAFNKKALKHMVKHVKAQMDSMFCYIEFANYYIQSDYENAYTVCKSFPEPPEYIPILKIYNIYYTALCEKALGNEEAAAEKFGYLASQNNTLDITYRAKEYLK